MYSADKSQTEVLGLAAALHRAYHPCLLRIALANSDNEARGRGSAAGGLRLLHPCPRLARGGAPLAWLTLTLKRKCWRQAPQGSFPGALAHQTTSSGPAVRERSPR